MMRTYRHLAGFTIAELAIVLAIVGLIFFAVSRNLGSIGDAQIKDMVSTIQQIREANSRFKERYKGLPGDLANANQLMPTLPPTSNGNGDGMLSAAESSLAITHLTTSGVLPSAANIFGSSPKQGLYSNVYLISTNLAASTASPCSGGTAIQNNPPTGVINVIVFEAVPANVAKQIDREFDDETFNSGKVRGSAAYTFGTVIACLAVPL